jgi:hypothetical protein
LEQICRVSSSAVEELTACPHPFLRQQFSGSARHAAISPNDGQLVARKRTAFLPLVSGR